MNTKDNIGYLPGIIMNTKDNIGLPLAENWIFSTHIDLKSRYLAFKIPKNSWKNAVGKVLLQNIK